ncbi:MAG: DUF167 domain-containing protein [Vicinamibacterales bacterium]
MITEHDGGITLDVRVIPRAGRTAIAGTRDGAVLVRLAAPPVDGAANAALVTLLADTLDVPRRAVRILAGETARTKRVRIDGIRAAAASARLGV